MNVEPGSLALVAAYGSQVRSGSHSSGGVSIAILISVAALIVSVILPLYLDSRQSPRVSVRISRLIHFDPDWNAAEYYVVSAINHGRTEVQINQVNISFIKRGGRGEEVFLTFLAFKLCPDLPHTLGPYSDASFAAAHEKVNEQIDKIKGCRLYGSLNLSSGYRVVSRRGLALAESTRIPNRHPRLRRLRLLILARERSRWR